MCVLCACVCVWCVLVRVIFTAHDVRTYVHIYTHTISSILHRYSHNLLSGISSRRSIVEGKGDSRGTKQ